MESGKQVQSTVMAKLRRNFPLSTLCFARICSMIVKYLASIALAAVLVVAGAARPVAQGRRGGETPAEAKTGTIEHIVVHGKALEGNLEGDSPDREVTVYLPPSYAGNPTRRYAVVY